MTSGELRLIARDRLASREIGQPIATKERWWRPTSEVIYRKLPYSRDDLLQGLLGCVFVETTPLAGVMRV